MISENSRKLMEILISSAEEYVKYNSAIATRGITAHMLENANVILNKMKAAAEAEDINSFNSLLVKLYRIIPRITNKSFFEYEKERAFERLNEEQIFIDAVARTREQKLSKGTPSLSNEENVLVQNGLEVYDITDEEKSFILKMMGSSRSAYINAWKVRNKKSDEAFEKYKKNRDITSTTMLWHGSPTENFLSIFCNGLDIAHANYGMFGKGVYFAPKFGKSRNYSNGFWKGKNTDINLLGIFEVATGKCFTPVSSMNYIDSIPNSFDCLWACARSGFLRNDEVVVYNDNASSIRYLVQAR